MRRSPAGRSDPPCAPVAARVMVLAVAAAGLLAPAAAAPARAGEGSPSAYDRPGMSHEIQCIASRDGAPVVLRSIEARQLTAVQAGRRIALSEPPLQPQAQPDSGPCVRIQAIEPLQAQGMRMYYTWPFEPGEVARGAAPQYPGLVWQGELARPPRLESAEAAEYGQPAPSAPGEPEYRVTPADINDPQQLYRGPSTGALYSFSPYGKDVGGAEFALLSWTWVDVDGGGIARAAVSGGNCSTPPTSRRSCRTASRRAGRRSTAASRRATDMSATATHARTDGWR